MVISIEEFIRTEMLIGKEAVERLFKSSVAVFGVGGVGSYAVEALARTGVGEIALFDSDIVVKSNINRQLIATEKTLGMKKVEAARERINELNSHIKVNAFAVFYAAENAESYDLSEYDYIIDAIDTVSSKLLLIERAKEAGVPIISCMGCGNKLDPTKFVVTDISKTSVCPLAKVMRHELKKRGIDSLKVVYSTEIPIKPDEDLISETEKGTRRQTPGSIAFVPSVAGLIAAGEAIKDIVNPYYKV